MVVLLGILVALFVALPITLIKSFFAMLLFGAVHHEVFAWVPALGFWQTVLVVLLVSTVLPTETNTTTSSK